MPKMEPPTESLIVNYPSERSFNTDIKTDSIRSHIEEKYDESNVCLLVLKLRTSYSLPIICLRFLAKQTYFWCLKL